jgi:hypothetical protein
MELNVPRTKRSLEGKSNQYEDHLHKLFENNPLPYHFSDALLNDADVTEVAKIGCFGPAEAFFQKLFGRLAHHEDVVFDSMCQQLNERLILEFGKCMLLHKSSQEEGKRIRFNEHMIKYLQSDAFTALVESSDVPEFRCRPGMCVVVQSLWRTLIAIVRNQLPSKVVDTLDSPNREVNFKVEVNSFFGWAIAEVHRSLLKELENDFEDNDPSIQARLDFVSEIRYLDYEAALNPSYLKDCYDGIYRFKNCGGLALVSPQYFGFGKELMQVIVDSLSPKDFDQHGSNAVKNGWEHIENHKDSLTKQFLECGKHYTAIDVKAKEKILETLLVKTRNARHGAEVKARRDKKTARGGENHSGISLRGGLKGTKVGCKVNENLKLKEE